MSESRTITDDQLAGIRTEIFAGRKIQAIKLYREAAGCGLKDAKDVVESLEDELRAKEPESFSATKKSGCASVVLIGISLIGAVAATARLLA